MSGPRALLLALRKGPQTNSQLGVATCDHSGSVARTMSKLIHSGRAKRIDGNSGRGSIAIYALTDWEV